MHLLEGMAPFPLGCGAKPEHGPPHTPGLALTQHSQVQVHAEAGRAGAAMPAAQLRLCLQLRGHQHGAARLHLGAGAAQHVGLCGGGEGACTAGHWSKL